MTGKTSKRDAKTGQFKQGFSGNPAGRTPGNPWLNQLKAEATPENWREVIRALFMAAKTGDTKATQLILRYLIPNPSSVSKPLEGDLTNQVQILKAALATGELNASETGALTRLLLFENLLATAKGEGREPTMAEVQALLNQEIELPADTEHPDL